MSESLNAPGQFQDLFFKTPEGILLIQEAQQRVSGVELLPDETPDDAMAIVVNKLIITPKIQELLEELEKQHPLRFNPANWEPGTQQISTNLNTRRDLLNQFNSATGDFDRRVNLGTTYNNTSSDLRVIVWDMGSLQYRALSDKVTSLMERREGLPFRIEIPVNSHPHWD